MYIYIYILSILYTVYTHAKNLQDKHRATVYRPSTMFWDKQWFCQNRKLSCWHGSGRLLRHHAPIYDERQAADGWSADSLSHWPSATAFREQSMWKRWGRTCLQISTIFGYSMLKREVLILSWKWDQMTIPKRFRIVTVISSPCPRNLSLIFRSGDNRNDQLRQLKRANALASIQ